LIENCGHTAADIDMVTGTTDSVKKVASALSDNMIGDIPFRYNAHE